MNPNSINIYMDIDSILDTKLPIYLKKDKDKLSESIKTGEYYDRVNNELSWITREEFNNLFENRTKDDLKLSIINSMYRTINSFTREALKAVTDEEELEINIVVNFHPYQLTDKEQELLLEGIKKKYFHTSVTGINKPITEITPSYIKTFNLVSMINFLEWLDIYSENEEILKDPIHQTLILTPIEIDEYEEDSNIDNLVDEVEKMLTLLCKVRFLPYTAYGFKLK